ncbi:MAG: cell division protein FtsA [Bdellovibrionota bacterium]
MKKFLSNKQRDQMEAKQDSHNIYFSLTLGSSHTSLVAVRLEQKSSFYESEFHRFQDMASPRIQILGASRLSNNGAIKKGIVSSIDALSSSILEVIDEVERQTGLHIENVMACIPCMSAQFDNHTENYLVKNVEIRQADVQKINNSVFNLKAPPGFEYMHAIPGSYTVDGKSEINNPVGMRGSQISLNFYRVYMPQADLHNIARSCYNAGVRVQRFVYEPLAAAEGALTEDEKEFGCVSISIGTYLTHVVVYLNRVPVFSKEFNLGSHHITKDLAIGLRTTQAEAERIKKDVGRAFQNSTKDIFEKIDIRGVDGLEYHTVTRQDVIQIIEPRVQEILETVYLELKKTKLLSKATKGVILSGGGALLNGISIATEKIYGHHARIGHPIAISGSTEGLKSPLWSAPIGAFSDLFKPLRENQFSYKFGDEFTFSKFATKLLQRFRVNP